MDCFERRESGVRSYCRHFPVVFSKAKGSYIYDEKGNAYLDFFDGAGALNYGHNDDKIVAALLEYVKNNGIMHALDMHTIAKKRFIEKFERVILQPRELDYKMMFCGSTGTNAVEAAFKLARKVTGRTTIFAFSGAFHGMSLGSLAATSDSFSRKGAGVELQNVNFMPYPFGFNETFDTIEYIRNVIEDDHSGLDIPAAIVVETVQAEGGVIVASSEWLYRLRDLCNQYEILMIVDDIQVGCGRTGSFFSFERAGITPDIVTLSKSISGCGLPMSLLLMRPDIDAFKPAEHNGTFRGNQLAFIGATEALDFYLDKKLVNNVKMIDSIVSKWFSNRIQCKYPKIEHRGIGGIHGIDFSKYDADGSICLKIAQRCFENSLIIERAGRRDAVLKIMPQLFITEEDLCKGLDIIEKCIDKTIALS